MGFYLMSSRMISLLTELDAELKTIQPSPDEDLSAHSALLPSLQNCVKHDTVSVLESDGEAVIQIFKAKEYPKAPYTLTVPHGTAFRIVAYAEELLKIRKRYNPEWLFTIKSSFC